jgi:DNA modification methylase
VQPNTIQLGHVVEELNRMAPKSVDMGVCSPPYWALRSYNLPDQIWGGSADCVHEWGAALKPSWNRRGAKLGTSSKMSRPSRHIVIERPTQAGNWCQSCSAWKGQLGMEPTPELYIEHIVLVLDAFKRVLADHGTLWLNLGDTAMGSQSATYGKESHRKPDASSTAHGWKEGSGIMGAVQPRKHAYLKAKDLCLIPHRVAVALQQAGWYVRSDNIWHKLSCMPENPSDRCVRDHEYVFQLTKKPSYYFDAYAIAEPAAKTDSGTKRRTATPNQPPNSRNRFTRNMPNSGKTTRAKRTVWPLPSEPGGHRYCRSCKAIYTPGEVRQLPRRGETRLCRCGSDNWVIHSAAYPPGLIRPLIQASTSQHGHCIACGKPYVRVTEEVPLGGQQSRLFASSDAEEAAQSVEVRTLGWERSCRHKDAGIRPGLVMDPFMGSGTTALVAREQGRNFLGIELNPEYLAIALERLNPTARHTALSYEAERVPA